MSGNEASVLRCEARSRHHQQVSESALSVEGVPHSGWRQLVKWMAERLLAGLLLALLAPVLGLIALVIKLDNPGPILFRQRRYGINKKPITIYKFRTMYPVAEGAVPFKQATQNDPRITRTGRLLRRTSLDELPQLFNVLQGSMSLVGPRPHPIELDKQFSTLLSGYDARFRVRPGITGWAQVNGWRGETKTLGEMRARIEHDLYYIEHWSLWFDLRILLRTACLGWVHRNAY